MYAESRMMTTSDGIELYNVIVRPKKEGKYPIILLFSPYSNAYEEEVTADNYRMLNSFLNSVYYQWDKLIGDGYAMVYQHIRGTGNSGGKYGYLVNEPRDNKETMEWLRTLEFYNGEVFRWGGSYLSWTAFSDLDNDYPDLKGMIHNVPGTFPQKLLAKNGFFKTGMIGLFMTGFTERGEEINSIKDQGIWRSFPQKDWPEQIWPDDDVRKLRREIVDISLYHPDDDDPFWKEQAPGRNIYKSIEKLNVPTLFLTSWYDHSAGTTIGIWDSLSEEVREKCAMIVSPYGHSLWLGDREAWPIKMDGSTLPDASRNYVEDWMNHIRTGKAPEFAKPGKITYFPEAGSKMWRSESKFANGETTHTMYLNSDRTLSDTRGEVSEVTYLYNPYNPASFYGCGGDIEPGYTKPGHEADNFHNIGMTPQDPPNFKQDVISFVSAPLSEEMSLKGRMSADVYVKSDCEDTCFYARVYVEKDGVTRMLRDDIHSLCYHGADYTPGEEVKVHFDFHPIAWDLKPGDKLRIDISSSAYGLYSVHTNVKGLQCEVEKPKIAHNTIVYGKSTFTFQTTDYGKDGYETTVVENRPDIEGPEGAVWYAYTRMMF